MALKTTKRTARRPRVTDQLKTKQPSKPWPGRPAPPRRPRRAPPSPRSRARARRSPSGRPEEDDALKGLVDSSGPAAPGPRSPSASARAAAPRPSSSTGAAAASAQEADQGEEEGRPPRQPGPKPTLAYAIAHPDGRGPRLRLPAAQEGARLLRPRPSVVFVLQRERSRRRRRRRGTESTRLHERPTESGCAASWGRTQLAACKRLASEPRARRCRSSREAILAKANKEGGAFERKSLREPLLHGQGRRGGLLPARGLALEEENLAKIRHIPTVIVQGRYDVPARPAGLRACTSAPAITGT